MARSPRYASLNISIPTNESISGLSSLYVAASPQQQQTYYQQQQNITYIAASSLVNYSNIVKNITCITWATIIFMLCSIIGHAIFINNTECDDDSKKILYATTLIIPIITVLLHLVYLWDRNALFEQCRTVPIISSSASQIPSAAPSAPSTH
jgi:hypothetical protein